MLSKARTKA